MTAAGRVAKRLLDLLLSATSLLLLWPLMLLLILLVRLDSVGPAIFRQQRAGRDMKPFTLYKLRTMRTDVDPYGISPTDGHDPRLTRLGRFLRESSLDELPQLWNVLKGDMSLVGPRPLYTAQAEQFNSRQRRRLEVRPGLTGLAQTTGRGDLPHAEKLELDVQYVENASLLLDIRIMMRTLLHVIRRKKVYQGWAGDGISQPENAEQDER
jgi:lipopolysaccharide/colanic/teichoic acid biosynthesis glycosyltransferase